MGVLNVIGLDVIGLDVIGLDVIGLDVIDAATSASRPLLQHFAPPDRRLRLARAEQFAEAPVICAEVGNCQEKLW